MALLSRNLKLKRSEHRVLGPASYAAGGPLFDPKAEAGMLSAPTAVLVSVDSVLYEGYYDHAAGKIVYRVAATGAQVADAVDLSAVAAHIVAHYA